MAPPQMKPHKPKNWREVVDGRGVNAGEGTQCLERWPLGQTGAKQVHILGQLTPPSSKRCNRMQLCVRKTRNPWQASLEMVEPHLFVCDERYIGTREKRTAGSRQAQQPSNDSPSHRVRLSTDWHQGLQALVPL